MERPTLRQLEIFAEVARVGTFRGAARALGLSQVAVSDHIRQLETRLGTALFVRSAGGKPTLAPAGRIVLEHGRNVLFACDALIAAARGAPGEGAGLAVAQQPAVATDVVTPVEPERATGPEQVPDIPAGSTEDKENTITIAGHAAPLSRFQDQLIAAQEAFPDRPIAVDFRCVTAATVQQVLAGGAADIVLFYALGETAGLASDYLWSENWSLLVREDHPLARKPAVDRGDCVDLPMIMLEPGNPLRPLCEESLARLGLWPAPTVLETDDYGRIAAELDFGEAAFAAFGVAAAQFATRPGLRRLALVEPLPRVEVRRALSPSAAEDPTICALAGLLA